MEGLEKDPAYLARVKERDARIEALAAEYAAEDALIAKQAKQLGYDIGSVWDFVNNSSHSFLPRPFLGPYERAYPMLVQHLRVRHHNRVREGIIRALIVKDGGEAVWSALLDEFRLETDSNLKWLLAVALRAAMPYKLRRKHPEIAAVYKAPMRSDKSLERTRVE